MDDIVKKGIDHVIEIINRFGAHEKLYNEQKKKAAEERRRLPKQSHNDSCSEIPNMSEIPTG